MQNKANLLDTQMNASYVKTKNYEQKTMNCEPLKQTQSKPIYGEPVEPTKPISSTSAALGRFLQPDPVMPYMQIAAAGLNTGDKIPGQYLYPAALQNYLQTDPLGRFLTTDPAARFLLTQVYGMPSELNLYTYCGNNPLNFTDPYGLSWRGIAGWLHLSGHATADAHTGSVGGGAEAFLTGGISFYAHAQQLENMERDPLNYIVSPDFKKKQRIIQACAE
jgi:RHS repeat-associated protein